LTQLQRTAHQKYCPYKGECAYTAFRAGERTLGQRRLELRSSSCRRIGIREYLAFDPDRVDAIEIDSRG